MNNYITYFKRLILFEKYLLFRTVNFRLLLLNLLFISLIVTLPSIQSMLMQIYAINDLENISAEIPEFTIENNEYVGEEKYLNVHNQTIVFSENYSSNNTDDLTAHFGFIKDGIYIKDLQNPVLDYSYIPSIKNNETLQSFVEDQYSNLYFYLFVYFLFSLLMNMTFTVLVIGLLSYIAHLISKMSYKKSRFMNWFKVSSFITLLFVFIQYILSLIINFNLIYIHLLSIVFYFYYFKKLPKNKSVH